MEQEVKQNIIPLGIMSLSTFVVCLTATFSQVIAVDLVLDLSPRNLMDFQWIFPLFLAGGCAGMALCAATMDHYGRRRAYLVSSVLFIIGTAVVASTTSMDILLVARIIEGLGYGGVIVTCVCQVKFTIKSPFARYGAHGILSIGFGGGHLFGIFLGQVALDTIGWREYLWVLLIAQVILTIPCMRYLRQGEHGKMKADLPGGITLAATVAVLLYAMQKIYMTHYVLNAFNIDVLLVLLLCFSLFVFVEVRDPESMLHRHVDDRKLLIASFVFIIMLGGIDMASLGWMVKTALFAMNMTVLFAGLCFMFVIAGAVVTAVTASKKIEKTGHSFWFILASVLSAVSLYSVSLLDIHSSVLQFCIHLFLIGAAIGCLVSLLNATIQNRTDDECNSFYTSSALMARTAGLWVGFNTYQLLVDIKVSEDLGPIVDYWNAVLQLSLPHDSSLANFLMTPLADALRIIPGLVDSIGSTFIAGVSMGFLVMGTLFLVIGLCVTYALVRGRKLV